MSEMESGFSLADVIGLVRRRSAVLLGGAIVGLFAGYLVFTSSPANYSATARIEIAQRPSADGSGTNSPQDVRVDIATESDRIKSDAVGDAVRQELSLEGDNRALFSSLVVTVREDSRILGLTYESRSASEARDIVNAIARSYLDQRSQAISSQRDTDIADVQKKLTEAESAFADASTAVDVSEPGSSDRLAAEADQRRADQEATQLSDQLNDLQDTSTSVGELVREAPVPETVLSKKALGMGVGVFGLFILAGLGVALLLDRRDTMGGGRRRIEQLVPGANIRMMPTAVSRSPSPAEIDAAIDRLAVELVSGGSRGRAASVLVSSARAEPPVAMAEELAASLTFAGIPTLFVLAGSTEREVGQAHVVLSFTDLISGPSITGPASLPEVAGTGTGASAPTVTWLRPRGSAEASGLLRRAVVEALITRAGREGFEAVIFVAASPTRNAAAAALGQWVAKTAVIVDGDESQSVESAVAAFAEADVPITEVVWA